MHTHDDLILVTGATGTIGSEVVRLLSQAGVKLRILLRNPTKVQSLIAPGVEVVQGDLSKPETLKAALDGVRKVFLLSSAGPSVVELQNNFVDAAKRIGDLHIVKLSTVGADEHSKTFGLRWHSQVELHIEQSGLPYTFLHPTFFMQNLLWMAPTIQTQGILAFPFQDTRVAIVDTRDIAAVAAVTLLRSGHADKTYMITGPESLSFDEIAKKLSNAIGKSVTYIDVPPAEFERTARQQHQPNWLIHDALQFPTSFVDGIGSEVTTTVHDIAKKNPISFDKFARDFAPLFVDQSLVAS